MVVYEQGCQINEMKGTCHISEMWAAKQAAGAQTQLIHCPELISMNALVQL